MTKHNKRGDISLSLLKLCTLHTDQYAPRDMNKSRSFTAADAVHNRVARGGTLADFFVKLAESRLL